MCTSQEPFSWIDFEGGRLNLKEYLEDSEKEKQSSISVRGPLKCRVNVAEGPE